MSASPGWLVQTLALTPPESVGHHRQQMLGLGRRAAADVFIAWPVSGARIAEMNPITHLATAEGGLMQGTASGNEILWVLAAAAILTAVFAH